MADEPDGTNGPDTRPPPPLADAPPPPPPVAAPARPFFSPLIVVLLVVVTAMFVQVRALEQQRTWLAWGVLAVGMLFTALSSALRAVFRGRPLQQKCEPRERKCEDRGFARG